MGGGGRWTRVGRLVLVAAMAGTATGRGADAATFVVNSTGDLADANTADGICQTSTPGQCTLRAAIQQANAIAAAHTINFSIPGTGVRTIAPATPLPQIVRQITIDGYSQPGAGQNTSATASNAVLLIEISGQHAGTGGQGLVFAAGSSSSVVSGLILNRFLAAGGLGAAIDIATSSVSVYGCWIGLAADGRTALPNGFGIRALSTSVLFAAIGGTTPALRNVISGNRTDGVRLCGVAHTVRGNIIGLAADGDSLVDNGDGWSQRIGVYVDDCTGTANGGGSVTIGGTAAGARNVISGNGGNVFLESGANLITNAYIGLNAAGTAARAPGLDCGAGIEIGRSSCDTLAFSTAVGNMVGGVTANERVLVSGLASVGIVDEGSTTLVRGSWFGLAADGVTVVPNATGGIRTRGPGAIIGGVNAGEGNVFAAAGAGTAIVIDGSANATVVRGNRIGFTANGSAAGSAIGVHVAGDNATIGGTAVGARNVISGHASYGIALDYTIDGTTTIEGNYIGTTIDGSAALQPALTTHQHGIFAGLHDASGMFTPSGTVVIGGVAGGAVNVIAGNVVGVKYTGACSVRLLMRNNRVGVGAGGEVVPNISHGVEVRGCTQGGSVVDAGNVVANNGGDGIRLDGAPGLGGVPVVGLQNNSVRDNGGLGINLVPVGAVSDAVTPNDAGDADTGPNGLLNFPVIIARTAFGSNWLVQGTYDGLPGTELTLNFYANASCDALGHGEGQQPVGVNTYRTDAQGRMNFSFVYPQAAAPGLDVITATATVGTATSEFSSCAADVRLTAVPSLDPVDVGVPVTYTMTVTNLSPVFVSNAGTLLFALPREATVLAAPGGTPVPVGRAGSGYRYSVPALAPGGTASFSIQLTHAVGGTIPISPDVTVTGDPVAANNSASAQSTVTLVVSGRVATTGSGQGLGGVTIALTGTLSATVATLADGTYRIAGLPAPGTYTLTPARAGATFAPPNGTLTNLTRAGTVDFAATVPLFTGRGRVIDLNGTGVPGIAVTLEGGASVLSAITGADGDVAFADALASGGTYTMTPSGRGFTFDVAARTLANVSGDAEVTFTVQTGIFERFFAEGATGAFFDTQFAVLNATNVPTTASFAFQRSDGAVVTASVPVGARSRATLDPKTVGGLASAEFSTLVTSPVPLTADRTMRWDGNGYGAHAETGILAPSPVWYLAEGATLGGFQLFYLIQNPFDTDAEVEVRFLRPAPAAPITRTYAVARRSRFNVWVNVVDSALASAEVSAVVTVVAGPPVIVERAMYLDGHGRVFDAGHGSAGVTAPALSWFLAEGATGPFFDLFVLVANPGDQPSQIQGRFLKPDGSVVTRSYDVPGNSRFNIWVDLEDPALADTAVSTTITSTNGVPVVVERTMWWPGGPADWREAHNSAGATSTGELWAVAEGEMGGALGVETYLLIANTSAQAGAARVTLLFEDGTEVSKDVGLAANSRTNVAVGAEFPQAAGRRFGALVESLGADPVSIVVERAMYNNAGGVLWAAGTNALAARMR